MAPKEIKVAVTGVRCFLTLSISPPLSAVTLVEDEADLNASSTNY